MAPSADYNAGESVLAVGGTAPPIVAVSGGGYTMEGGEGDNDPEEDDDDSVKEEEEKKEPPVVSTEVPIQIEVYEPFDSLQIQSHRDTYITKLNEKFAGTDNEWTKELEELKKSYNENKKEPAEDKLFEIIPTTVKTIICIQPIGGALQSGGRIASSILGLAATKAAAAIYAAPSTLMPKRAARLAAAKVEAEKAEAAAVAAKSKAAEAETKAKAAEAEAAARDDELSRHPLRVDFAEAAEAAKYTAATARAAAAAAAAESANADKAAAKAIAKTSLAFRTYATAAKGTAAAKAAAAKAATLMPKRAAEEAALDLILPGIQEHVTTFLKTFQFLYTQGLFQDTSPTDLRLKKGVCIILYGLFTGDVVQDKILLYLFLKMKQSNKDTVYLLRDPENRGNPDENLSSPSYVIYGSPIGNYKGIVFTKEPSKVDTTTYAKYYTISPGTISAPVVEGGTTDHPLCAALKNFETSLDKLQLSSTDPHYITILRIGVRDSNPLICADESGVQYSPFVSGAFRSGDEASAYIEGHEKVKLLIDGKAYLIRVATPEEEALEAKGAAVMGNWKQGIFSKGEANLLNDLQLSPALLSSVFGDIWKDKLATFLDHISNPVYKCYSNVSIIQSRLCDHTREFINKVLEKRYEEELHKTIFKNVSKRQPGVWPKEFTQIERTTYTKTNPAHVVIISASTGQAGYFEYNEKEAGKKNEELAGLQRHYKNEYEILSSKI